MTNSGTLSVTGSSIETATGLDLNGRLLEGGEIINTGTITVDFSDDSVSGSGINVRGNVSGEINNSGTIAVKGQAPILMLSVTGFI